MNTAKSLLHQFEIRPRKRYGQSFLEDRSVMEQIVRLAEIEKDETVLEIGSGLGLLTERIAARARRVFAVEIDAGLSEILAKRLGQTANVEILNRDILSVDPADLASRSDAVRLKVIGNIPYNISTPILFHLLAHRAFLSSVTVMLQKELADRLTAPCGRKEYGVPTVLFAMFSSVSGGIDVAPSCFYPPPNVRSRVLKFDFRSVPCAPLGNEEYFVRVVRAAFAMRRKTLFNCLRTSDVAPGGDASLRKKLFEAEIDGNRRAETLTPGDFARLSNVLLRGMAD